METIGLNLDELIQAVQESAQTLAHHYPDHPRDELLLTVIAMAISKNNEKILADINTNP